MSNTNTQDECHDMPSLLCGECDGAVTKGGPTWEEENPTTKFCKCTNEPSVGDKRPTQSDGEEASKRFARNLQGTGIGKGMDEANRTALQVMANEGSAAAVRHMFTDQKTGRTLSYAEMRMLYG